MSNHHDPYSALRRAQRSGSLRASAYPSKPLEPGSAERVIDIIASCGSHICKAPSKACALGTIKRIKRLASSRVQRFALRLTRASVSTDANRPGYVPAQSCPRRIAWRFAALDARLGFARVAVDPCPIGVRVAVNIPVTGSLFTLTRTLTCAYLIWRDARRLAVVDFFQVPFDIE